MLANTISILTKTCYKDTIYSKEKKYASKHDGVISRFMVISTRFDTSISVK